MGVAAHALDELKGRPLRTRIPDRVLVALGVVSLAAAVAIGVGAALAWGYGLLAFIVVGAVARAGVQPRARLPQRHRLRARWGAFPALTGYFVEAQTLRLEAIAAAIYAFALEPRAASALDAGAPRPARSTAQRQESSRSSAPCGC